MKTLSAPALALALAWGFASGSAAAPAETLALRTAPAVLKEDRAYILFRTNRPQVQLAVFEQIFLRVPDAIEIDDFQAAKRAAYAKDLPNLTKAGRGIPIAFESYQFRYRGRPNLFSVKTGQYLDDSVAERTFLVEAPPGDYVVIGQKAAALTGFQVCHCMGTVRFEASKGVITDLGSLLSARTSRSSDLPEFSGLTGVDKTILLQPMDLIQAVRPATKSTSVPPGITNLPRHPADYRAIGSSPATGAAFVDRLAPLEGVLRFEGANIIDVKSGEVLD